jgi:hypothetical protein
MSFLRDQGALTILDPVRERVWRTRLTVYGRSRIMGSFQQARSWGNVSYPYVWKCVLFIAPLVKKPRSLG